MDLIDRYQKALLARKYSKRILNEALGNGGYIFRRTRKCPKTGKILDAKDYGHKAWKLRIF